MFRRSVQRDRNRAPGLHIKHLASDAVFWVKCAPRSTSKMTCCVRSRNSPAKGTRPLGGARLRRNALAPKSIAPNGFEPEFRNGVPLLPGVPDVSLVWAEGMILVKMLWYRLGVWGNLAEVQKGRADSHFLGNWLANWDCISLTKVFLWMAEIGRVRLSGRRGKRTLPGQSGGGW